MAAYPRDIFVYRYGSKRWAWRFETGRAQEIFETKDGAIIAAREYKRRYNNRYIFVENKIGGFTKLADDQ